MKAVLLSRKAMALADCPLSPGTGIAFKAIPPAASCQVLSSQEHLPEIPSSPLNYYKRNYSLYAFIHASDLWERSNLCLSVGDCFVTAFLAMTQYLVRSNWCGYDVSPGCEKWELDICPN
jgi:hypothetical protein